MVVKKKLADFIVEDFKSKLESGEFKKGDKLPNQSDMAKDFGVSRLSLREAMQYLVNVGAISQRPKVGTIIINDDPETWSEPLHASILNNVDSVNELLDARIAIESSLAGLCARNASLSALESLHACVDEQATALKQNDIETFWQYDVEFHKLIASYASNRYLYRMYAEIWSYTEQFVHESFYQIKTMRVDAMRLHRLVYSQIASHNEENASALMRDHILRVKAHYNEYQTTLEDVGETGKGE